MEAAKDMSPKRQLNANDDQNTTDAESQITFLRLKLKLVIKDSAEKYDEVKIIIPELNMPAFPSSLLACHLLS